MEIYLLGQQTILPSTLLKIGENQKQNSELNSFSNFRLELRFYYFFKFNLTKKTLPL